jgi:5-methylcytosine-specific restriction protein B
MRKFDQELRDTEEWANWEQSQTHKYAIAENGQRYPVKQIIRMATGDSDFSGGYEANSYVTKRGFSIVSLRDDKNEGNNLSIRDGLEEILDRYVVARLHEPLKGHELRSIFKQVTSALAATEAVSKRSTLTVKFSMGQGNWATIPWIALLDTRETDTTQRGTYCVYLFREDMSGIYLKLAQGVTEPMKQYGAAKGRKHLRARAKALRRYGENGKTADLSSPTIPAAS